ncbi:MAG TPA: M48 family metalloprotease, partial [Syntrophales bacterium]|nr:M48 family metalloprotease [Syntrophales bacterium]
MSLRDMHYLGKTLPTFMIIHPRRNILKILVTVLAIVYLHVSAEPSLASFTLQDEKRLGKEFYDKLKSKEVFIKDPKVTTYIDRIGQLLLSHMDQSFFDYTFSIIDSPAINAFATPGGYIYVYRGLIELTEEECQLAGVLAHEIGHIKARHVAQMIESSQKMGLATLAAILASAFLGGGDLTAAVVGFSSATATTLSLKYSREHEEEADRLGMLYLTQSGYDGEGTLDFLKMMRQYEFYSNSVPSYFLTHPGTTDRIRYLDGLLQTKYKNRGSKNITGELERIKTTLVINYRDPDSSLKYFQNVLRKDPDDPNALYGLAVVQGRLGQTSESFSNFQKALVFSPGDPDILRDLGIAYFQLGRMGEATDVLRKARTADKKDIDTALYLGKAFVNTGEYDAALEIYKECLEQNPDDIPVHHNLAILYGKLNMKGESHYHFGVFFKKGRKLKSALFHFKAAYPLFPPGSDMAVKIREEIDSIE